MTFECEPGTLPKHKLDAIRGIGVTRLSLGVENFERRDPRVQRPGASVAGDLPRLRLARVARLPADQHRPDRRHGRRDGGQLERLRSRRRSSSQPDSVTIYQMELPFNTIISSDLLKGTGRFCAAGRRLADEAALGASTPSRRSRRPATHVRSAYTAVKDPTRTRFVYRDRLWQGADMFGLGVASFGHVNGVHVQNVDTWETYAAAIRRDELPLSRAYRPTHEERLIREFILQLKLGSIQPAYFRDKYQVDVLRRFREPLDSIAADGYPRDERASRAKGCCESMDCSDRRSTGFDTRREVRSRARCNRRRSFRAGRARTSDDPLHLIDSHRIAPWTRS